MHPLSTFSVLFTRREASRSQPALTTDLDARTGRPASPISYMEEGSAYITKYKALVLLRLVLQDIFIAGDLQKKSDEKRLLFTSIKPLIYTGRAQNLVTQEKDEVSVLRGIHAYSQVNKHPFDALIKKSASAPINVLKQSSLPAAGSFSSWSVSLSSGKLWDSGS